MTLGWSEASASPKLRLVVSRQECGSTSDRIGRFNPGKNPGLTGLTWIFPDSRLRRRDVRHYYYNSTQTRINRSHLIDLLDRISIYDDETRLAANIVRKLYE